MTPSAISAGHTEIKVFKDDNSKIRLLSRLDENGSGIKIANVMVDSRQTRKARLRI